MSKLLFMLAVVIVLLWAVGASLVSLYNHYLSGAARERRRLERQKLDTDLSYYTLENKIEFLEAEREKQKT